MPRYVFDEVSIKATHVWKDEAGKRRQRTQKFFQTVNPFNKNAAGLPKTREEITAELIAERDAWLAAPSGAGGNS